MGWGGGGEGETRAEKSMKEGSKGLCRGRSDSGLLGMELRIQKPQVQEVVTTRRFKSTEGLGVPGGPQKPGANGQAEGPWLS